MNVRLILSHEVKEMRQKDDEKKQRIESAVIELILDKGFNGLSMSKIAKEAGVCPATVYTYFDSKDSMLQEIYVEYSEDVYDYLLGHVNRGMTGEQIISSLIRSYYNYLVEYRDVFSYVKQYSMISSAAEACGGAKGSCYIREIIDDLKRDKVIRNYSNETLEAVIFYPVQSIAENRTRSEEAKEEELNEFIEIIQNAILL